MVSCALSITCRPFCLSVDLCIDGKSPRREVGAPPISCKTKKGSLEPGDCGHLVFYEYHPPEDTLPSTLTLTTVRNA